MANKKQKKEESIVEQEKEEERVVDSETEEEEMDTASETGSSDEEDLEMDEADIEDSSDEEEEDEVLYLPNLPFEDDNNTSLSSDEEFAKSYLKKHAGELLKKKKRLELDENTRPKKSIKK